MQFRDDPRFQDAWAPQPDEDMERREPVFCLRLSLARLVHRFTKLGVDTSPTSEAYINNVEDLHGRILELRESIPLEWRPGHDIFAEPELYRGLLLLHLEYHALCLAVFTSLSAFPAFHPSKYSYNSAQLRRQITGRVTSARIVLQTLKTIGMTPGLNLSLSGW